MLLSESLFAEVTSLIVERLSCHETLCELFVQQVEQRMKCERELRKCKDEFEQLTEKIGLFECDLRYAKTMLASVKLGGDAINISLDCFLTEDM